MATSLEFKTNLNCGSCVAAVQPFLDQIPQISGWHVDTAGDDKILTVQGDGVSMDSVEEAVAKAGFQAKRRDFTRPDTPPHNEASGIASQVTYFTLFLLGAYLMGIVGLLEAQGGS